MKTVNELFKNVKFENVFFDEDILFDADKTKKFVQQAVFRNDFSDGVPLEQFPVDVERSSVRNFDVGERISQSDFSGFFNVLRRENVEGKVKFSFPSAGGLYPVDIYIYIKENRVSGLKDGIYQYNAGTHSMKYISDRNIQVTAHYYNNRNIFTSSAFSVYLFYQPFASFPKYGGMGLYYGILDAGIILQQLSISACKNNMGSCIIGDMNFDKVKDCFPDDESIYLCCMEVGYPLKECVKKYEK